MQDPHWTLYTDHCSPCLTNYTLVVQTDGPGEQEAALTRLGLPPGLVLLHLNRSAGGGSAALTPAFLAQVCLVITRNIFYKYPLLRTCDGCTVEQLDCATLRALHQRYWPDFLFFQFRAEVAAGRDCDFS